MPPIPQQGSRAGLITALVIFAILFVTSTIFAFIYSARATRAELDMTNFAKEANGVYARGALNSPEYESLKNARTAEGSGMSAQTALVDVALKQTRDVATLIGGKDPVNPTASALATGTRALNGAKDKLKASGITLPNDLSSAVTALADAVVARDRQIVQLTADRDASVAQITAANEQQTTLAAANEKAIAEVRAQADAATASFTSYQGE